MEGMTLQQSRDCVWVKCLIDESREGANVRQVIDSIDREEPAMVSIESLTGRRRPRALVAAAKGGNLQAFDVLVEPARADDVFIGLAQDAAIGRTPKTSCSEPQKAFLISKKFEGESLFSTWLTRIAINEVLMLLRSKSDRREC